MNFWDIFSLSPKFIPPALHFQTYMSKNNSFWTLQNAGNKEKPVSYTSQVQSYRFRAKEPKSGIALLL